MVETSLGIAVHVFKEVIGIGGIFKSLARYAIPLFKQGAKVVGKRALQAATEQGARTLLRQPGHGSKGRRSQRSNLSSVKKKKLEDPRLTKWITDDESSHDDESSYDDESDSETSQTSDDIY